MSHLPKIIINTIPHKKQRYPTCGDYFMKDGALHFRISKMSDTYEFLVLIHELTEWFLTHKKGVTIEEIDSFDINFEKHRAENSVDEPGDDPQAPYYFEHQFATFIEKLIATQLGVNWDDYNTHVNNL